MEIVFLFCLLLAIFCILLIILLSKKDIAEFSLKVSFPFKWKIHARKDNKTSKKKSYNS